MTGYTPDWQRYLYYRLSWRKVSGARLNIVWRFCKDWDRVNGWTGAILMEALEINIYLVLHRPELLLIPGHSLLISYLRSPVSFPRGFEMCLDETEIVRQLR